MPTGFNGTHTVTSSTLSTVSYTLNINPGSPTTSVGEIKGQEAVYTLDKFGILVNLANFLGSHVVSAISDPNTGALISIGLNTGITNGPYGTNELMIIQVPANTLTGHFLQFSSPVPNGKLVTVLHGFDK
jgi:hypothetical protein